MASYQVIARKFRPSTFAEVVGQEHVTRTLQNAIRAGRIPHAFLFTGTRGCGKTSTARILAKALNCTAGETPGEEPCNQCDNCQEITSGSSLDVLEIDGASNNGVENIRELRENVRFMPNRGRYKVYIIDEAHMLSQAAWNALLKTLEEPPAHIAFAFATTEPQKVPETILSRCQRFDFKRIPAPAIAGHLGRICEAEGIELSPRGLASLAEAADGSLRDGQSLLDQLISYAGTTIQDDDVSQALGLIDRTLVTDAMRALAGRDASAILGVTRRVTEAGHDASTFAREVLKQLRNLMIAKVIANPGEVLSVDDGELQELQGWAQQVEREQIDGMFAMLAEVMDELRGESPYLALEMALLRMTSTEPLEPLSSLIERAESLMSGQPAPARTRPTPRESAPVARPQPTAPVTRPPAQAQGASASKPPEPAASPAPPENPAPAPRPMPGGVFDWEGFVSIVRQRSGFLGTYLRVAWLCSVD